jgi:light-regulated signal transduction histidine kinase (bacteriophytochrome)
VAEELRAHDPGRAVTVEFGPDLEVEADPGLARILENLLGNAWKFTRPCADPRISLSVESHGSERVFHLRDNGVGFDMAYSGKLFAAFQRLHSEQEFSGTGIGLATVHRVISRHGGRIWAMGEIDRGASFYFTWPG